MKLNNIITLLLLLTTCQLLVGQAPKYGHTVDVEEVEDYYMFPIRPNQVNTLAGNMGELRTSHFHAGLDIRTGGRTGLPVYAAADGYISRISVSPVGYGKALYINHPNGETTVYAHLEKFIDTIDTYTKLEQYNQQQLHVKLFPNKQELFVKKGSIIAYSGNSGSSGGPHLHFEIRDENHIILNPLKYNFEEIIDTTAPTIKSLALSPFSTSSRVNSTFERKKYKVEKASKIRYIIRDTIEVYGEIGFELYTYDKLNGANYKCGVSEIDFFIDDELLFHQKIDSLSFLNQRDILTHYNYPEYVKTGIKYNKLYVDEGNELDLYETNNLKGKKIFTSSKTYAGLVKVTDILGNASFLEFVLKSTPPNFEVVGNSTSNVLTQTNNFMVINNEDKDSTIQILSPGGNHYLTPVYTKNSKFTYLWDLAKAPVHGIDLCDSLLILDEVEEIPSNTKFDFYSKNINTHFRKNSLFDTMFYISKYHHDTINSREVFEIGNANLYPLKNYIDIALTPLFGYNNEKTAVYKINGKSYNYIGGKFVDNQYKFSTRELGKYTLLEDSIAPTITPISITKKFLKFKISDQLSGIKDFNVFVNDEWVLMDYDYKTNFIWSIDLVIEETEAIEIKVVVTDRAKNETIYTSKLN